MIATETLRTKEQNRKLWWLFGRIGFDKEAVADFVSDYTQGRTCHTAELTFIEARDMIAWLDSTLTSGHQTPKSDSEKMDRLRKGCMRSIFAWFEKQGRTVDSTYVKAVACRAAGKSFFNELTEGDLRRVYAEFCKKQTAQRGKEAVA
ncbi:MAG: hypothetical protein J6I49_03450 [Bacteroidales bacterium]|nr:hypothetical protein [Bacteroidales bacterium]